MNPKAPRTKTSKSTVTVTLDKIATVDVSITALEGAVNVSDYTKIFVEPAAVALAQKINSDGLALYKDIPYVCGTAGTTPADLAALADVRKSLKQKLCAGISALRNLGYRSRRGVYHNPAIVNAEKSGSTEALRSGSIGRIFGLENYMSQAVKQHTKGTLSAEVKPKSSFEAGG